MIGWNFPSNNNGLETGLNDAGIESFRGNRIESLAREIIQNSCDAKIDNDKPVLVTFEFKKLLKKDFPCYLEFKNILSSCKEYWKDNQKASLFFENASKVLNSEELPLFKISDYNTTGLTGSNQRGSNWHNLIKSVGSSHKIGGTGGSFGIGKNAPFACSDLRTVFYSTKDNENNFAFQGVSKLVTFLDKNKNTTQGTGYFGFINGNLHITDKNQIPTQFLRTEIGTDIYIPGFSFEEDWEESIVKTILENFLVAIFEGKLEVKVNDVIIDKNNLKEMISTYTTTDDTCLSSQFYEALTSNEKYFKTLTFFEADDIELHILFDDNFKKKVAMVRKTGMKILNKDYRIPTPYSAVMIVKGDDLNNYLRSIENPQHNNWEEDRHENTPHPKNTLKKFYKTISDTIKEYIIKEDIDEMDIDGLGQFLPDDLEEDFNEYSSSQGEKTKPKKVELETIIHKSTVKNKKITTEVPVGEEDENQEDSSNEPPTVTTTTQGGGGGNGGGGTGIPPKKPTNSNNKNKTNGKQIELQKIRSFCSNAKNGSYNIKFESPKNMSGYIYIDVVGEDGNEPGNIKNVYFKDTNKSPIFKNNFIGPFELTESQILSLVITLKDFKRCALEVTFREI